ncbi:hypothetical protein N431DRAFT_76487 [Stipitochalara longipes BDJ]|nr:hypothetical protein N431DRAFT_76487 [Stipitochalara longipes BDJ]
MMTCPGGGHYDCEGSVVAGGVQQATENDLPQDDTSQEASRSESLSSNDPLSVSPTFGSDLHLHTPLDQSSAAAEQLATTAAESNANDVVILDHSINQQLLQSRAYTVNTSNNAQDDLEIPLAHRTSYANDAESSDDSETSNEYSLIAQVQNLDGRIRDILVSADTGAPSEFIFRSALDQIGRVTEIPIPQRKLKEYTNPLDKDRKEVPQFFVFLLLYNSVIGLCEEVRLKVFELSEGTNGYGIILGRSFIRNHGGHRFLAKVEDASFAEPRLAGIRGNSFGTLLKSRRTKEQKLLDEQNNDKLREQTKAIASKLYASSGLGIQSSATATWSEASRSQDPSARSAGSATWHPSAQQPNGLPFYHGARAGQQTAPDHNAPLRDLPGEWASRRTNTNNTSSTQFTQDTIFSITRQDTDSTMSSCSSVPTVATIEEKVAGRTVNYSVPQSRASCDVHKQSNE